MYFLRPVEARDLPALMRLAKAAGPGLTTLPHDSAVLKGRIADSLRGFKRMAEKPGGETYLFVMEDSRSHRVVGTSAMVSKVGGFEPFYTYGVETVVHESAQLGVRREVQVLKLIAEHNGPSEIGTLYLDPRHRGGGAGRLLSLGRFLFVADHRRFFDKSFLVEMRGRIDARGRSPFWEAVGRHFFGIDFQMADRLVMKDKRFIAELMPRHPIYIPILPKSAQAVIGKVHPETEPALRLLRGEGFSFVDQVDIFEGGPVLSCPTDSLRLVRESHKAKVSRVVTRLEEGRLLMLSNARTEKFRACIAQAHVSGRALHLERETARVLGVKEGDSLRWASPRPPETEET